MAWGEPIEQGLSIPEIITSKVQEYGLAPEAEQILQALAHHESKYDPLAKNRDSSASGVFQIIRGTGSGLGMNVTRGADDDRWNPVLNVDAAIRNLLPHLEKGDYSTALKVHYGHKDPAKNEAFARTVLRASKIAAGQSAMPKGSWGEPIEEMEQSPGLISSGNIDLNKRPVVKNQDNSISTVRSMSFNDQGKEVLIPTVHPEGRIMNDEEAIGYYRKTGQHLGIFDTPENATAYAQKLHEEQAQQYSQDKFPGQWGEPIEDQKPKQPKSGLGRLVSQNIAEVNRPILDTLVGAAGIMEDVMAWPYKKITGDERPIQRPLSTAAKKVREIGAPESLKVNEEVPLEKYGTMPGKVVGGILPYAAGAVRMPEMAAKAGTVAGNLLNQFLKNYATFLPIDVAKGYEHGGEEGAKQGISSAALNSALFSAAQILPGRFLPEQYMKYRRGVETAAAGGAFAGAGAIGGNRDPLDLTLDFLVGAGLHLHSIRGQKITEADMTKYLKEWQEKNNVNEGEWKEVQENLTSSPEELNQKFADLQKQYEQSQLTPEQRSPAPVPGEDAGKVLQKYKATQEAAARPPDTPVAVAGTEGALPPEVVEMLRQKPGETAEEHNKRLLIALGVSSEVPQQRMQADIVKEAQLNPELPVKPSVSPQDASTGKTATTSLATPEKAPVAVPEKAKLPHEMRQEEFIEDVRLRSADHVLSAGEKKVQAERHKNLVAQALNEGKLTPEQAKELGLYDDYPEFAPRTAPKPVKAKEPWEMTREEFASPETKVVYESTSQMKDRFKTTGEAQHADIKNNKIILHDKASNYVKQHEMAHIYTEEPYLYPHETWVYYAEKYKIGNKLSEYFTNNKGIRGGGLNSKVNRRSENINDPFNYNWQESSADLVAGYMRGDLTPQLKAMIEGIAKDFPKNKLAKLVNHRESIEKALASGKPVPPEVLADYPDLKAKPKTAEPVGKAGVINRINANPADLAADYKARGIGRQESWSRFVIDKALRPGMDAKDFYKIYDSVSPEVLKAKQVPKKKKVEETITSTVDPEFARFGEPVEFKSQTGKGQYQWKSGEIQRVLNDGEIIEVKDVEDNVWRMAVDNIKTIPQVEGAEPSSQMAPTLGSESYVEAKKNPGGFYQLFYRGTRNEVFPGEKFKNANEARQYFKVQKVKEASKVPLSEKGAVGFDLEDIQGKSRIAKSSEGRKVEQVYEDAEAQLKELKSTKLKRVWEKLKHLTTDTSSNIKKALLDQAGAQGKEAVMRHDLSRGASAKAQAIVEDGFERVYKKLSPVEETILNRALRANRDLTILGYKPEHRVTGGLTKQELQKYLDEVPPEIRKRVNEYSKIMDENLTAMQEAGLLNEAQAQALREKGDYLKTKYIQYLDPDRVSFDARGRKITVPDSGIKKLDAGSEQAAEMNSRLLMAEVIGRTQSRIFRNQANDALYQYVKDNPDNPLGFKLAAIKKKVRGGDKYADVPWEDVPYDYDMTEIKPEAKATYKWDVPAGHTEVSVMQDGKRIRMILPDKYAREWVQADPLISSTAAEIIGWASGSKILKTFATGVNPGFALTNLPRDIAHIWLTTEEYSKFGPKFLKEMGGDLKTVAKDAIKREGRYRDYIDEGGGMSFLTHQGELKLGGSGPLAQLQKYAAWVGETSEILTRLAVRERAIKNGKTPEEATWIARKYLDFAQGGSFAKAADTAIPYLNASIQGTRQIVNAAHRNPADFMWKVGQIGALATGLYIANSSFNKEAWDSIPEKEKVTNWIVTTPFDYKDKEGNKRYLYFRIAKDQGQRVFASVFEGLMGAAMGHPVDGDQIKSAIADFLPIVPTEKLPPSFMAMLGYVSNKDFWRNKDIWRGPKIEDSKEITKWTHPALIKAGEYTGMSPERLGYALSNFIPPTNTYASLVGGGLRKMMEDVPERDREKAFEEMLQGFPMMNKLFRSTDPYEAHRKFNEKARIDENTRRYEQELEVKKIIENMSGEPKDKQRQAQRDYVSKQKSEDRKRIDHSFNELWKYQDIPDRKWWLDLKHMYPEARASVFWERIKDMPKEEQDEWRAKAMRLPGIYTKGAFQNKLYQLRKQQSK